MDTAHINRFIVKRSVIAGRWIVVDRVKGGVHSNPIADKARAQRQADTMNAKVARIGQKGRN